MTVSEPGPPQMPPPDDMPPSGSAPVSWAAAPPAQAGPMPGLRYAGFWVRLVAFIIDAIILAVIGAALSPLFGGPTVVQTPTGVEINSGATGIQLLVDLLYFVGFWMWRAQTPGMIPFNMRVVRADNGENVDVSRAILRYVGLIISFAVLLLGVIWVAFDGRKQGWHDKLAGTLVVRPT